MRQPTPPPLKQTPAGKIKPFGPVKHRAAGHRHRIHKSGHQGGGGEHGGEGTWIFSYADMITILMTFFILMLSISNVSAEKFDSLKESLKAEKSTAPKKPKTVEASQELKNLASKNSPTLAGIPLDAVAEKAAATGGDRLAQLSAGVRILLDSVNKELVEQDSKQATEFERLKSEAAQIANVAATTSSQQSKRAELTITLPTNEVFGPQGNLTPATKKFLAEMIERTKMLQVRPFLRVETHVSSATIRNPQQAMRATIAEAAKLSEAAIEAGVDPALLTAAAYGVQKPLVDEKDRYGKPIPAAPERNNRIVFTFERRPLEVDKEFKNKNFQRPVKEEKR
jgi:flagellar motor protein MotB